MKSAAESARWADLTLASHYRRKAHLSLARARDARWSGREHAVPALVEDFPLQDRLISSIEDHRIASV